MTWDKLHQHYETQDWTQVPSIFATEAVTFFPPGGKILEIGAGLGQDSRFFHSRGYVVDSTDFSDLAIELNTSKSSHEIQSGRYQTSRLDVLSDLVQILPAYYDIVYAHLSLHYFSEKDTLVIRDQIYRILRPGGIFAVLLNSLSDPEYGQGEMIEQDYFEIPGQNRKRYFSVESARYFFLALEGVQARVIDNHGETYKDSAKGIHNLIRVIGQK